MSIEVDTNIALRVSSPAHPMHHLALDAIRILGQQGERLCMMPQNLYEFWVAATRPMANNGLGLTITEVASELTRFRRWFTILDDLPAILPAWEQLVVLHQVMGKNAHDARLVAAMQVHGINRILTFNTPDFQRYPGITAISPYDLMAQSPA